MGVHATVRYEIRLAAGRLGMLLCLLIGTAPAAGADSSPTAEELVRQLGASSFEQRELAEDLLQRRGTDALAPLREVADDSDLELRYRARRLIDRIELDMQWRLLATFQTHYDAELAHQLPGWTRYSELVGDDLPARQLYMEMFAAEPEIMLALDQPALSAALEEGGMEMQSTSQRSARSMTVPAASTAALLLASLDPHGDTNVSMPALIHSQVNESAFMRAATRSSDPPIRRLLSAWVSRARHVPAATRRSIGAKFELRAAVDPALELIHSQAHGSQLQYAIFTLARLGGSEHIPALEDLLDNATVVSERQRGDEEPFTCQIRDVALAGLLHLIGKQPREFGFDQLRPNSNSLFALNTAGFASEEDRRAAFRKWKLWQAAQRHDARGVDENAVEGIGL